MRWRKFERGTEFLKADFGEDDEVVHTGEEKFLPDDIVEDMLHEGCSESGDGLLAESCSPRGSKGGGCRGELWKTG